MMTRVFPVLAVLLVGVGCGSKAPEPTPAAAPVPESKQAEVKQVESKQAEATQAEVTPTEPAPGPTTAATGANPAKRYFGDIILTNQDGKRVNLYDDLIRDHVVVINVFFSHCTGSCPVMSRTFSTIQERLGERLGKDAYLISISVDPERDTPEKLKAYAGRFKARPGWHLLTGDKPSVEAALRKLGQSVRSPAEHKNLFLVGNDRTGLWKKVFGLSEVKDIIAAVDSVLNDKGEDPPTGFP